MENAEWERNSLAKQRHYGTENDLRSNQRSPENGERMDGETQKEISASICPLGKLISKIKQQPPSTASPSS